MNDAVVLLLKFLRLVKSSIAARERHIWVAARRNALNGQYCRWVIQKRCQHAREARNLGKNARIIMWHRHRGVKGVKPEYGMQASQSDMPPRLANLCRERAIIAALT